MRYEGVIFRPPSEAYSLLIQATIGCPHNRCAFCSMYKNTRFRIRPVEEIKADLRMARQHYGEHIYSLFFPDGNTIVMKTDQLVEIFEYAHELFPYLSRITVYGSARFVSRKSSEDLSRLHQAGLRRIHMGMESGDAITLENLKKGTTPEQIIDAGKKIMQAGIEVSEYYLVGAGSHERSYEHAVESARVLNAFSPDFIRLRTLVPIPGTPLFEAYREGTFQLLPPLAALKEIRLLIEHLEVEGSMLLSDHVSNYLNVQGKLPEDKAQMISQLDKALTKDESFFRKPDPFRL